jgi:hypothetical protein
MYAFHGIFLSAWGVEGLTDKRACAIKSRVDVQMATRLGSQTFERGGERYLN